MRAKPVRTALIALGVLSISVLGFCVHPAKGIIWVEGHITSDTAWTPVDTYRVIGDAYVDAGVTLTIDPGVRVEFADDLSLFVEGSLNASGTSHDPIVFTSSRTADQPPTAFPGAWNTIGFNGTLDESFLLNHVTIEYASDGVTVCSLGLVAIERAVIERCAGNGIGIAGRCNLIVKETEIRYNHDGVRTDETEVHTGITIIDSSIHHNEEEGIYAFSYGKDSLIFGLAFSNNTVSENGGRGICLQIRDIGAYSDLTGYIYNVSFSGNNILSNGGSGIHLQNDCFVETSHGNGAIYDVAFSSNNISLNDGDGISLAVLSHDFCSIYNVSFLSNTISLNSGSGICMNSRVYSHNASIHDISFSSNTVSSNGATGIDLESHSEGNWAYGDSYAYFYNASFISNSVSFNRGTGIRIESLSYDFGYISNLTFSYNTLFANDVDGIALVARAFAGMHIHSTAVSSNIISANGHDGLSLDSYGALATSHLYNLTVVSNVICSNSENGIYATAWGHHVQSAFDLEFSENTISANHQKGLFIDGHINSNVTHNSISYNRYGVFYDITNNNLARSNDLYSNIHGMNVVGGATVDAENNYWGHSSGPYHPSQNPEGHGNPANGDGANLDFIPFLTTNQSYVNIRPVALLSVDTNVLNLNETAIFDATDSYDDREIVYYLFDFGDGTSSGWVASPVATHEYDIPGYPYVRDITYNASVVVIDNHWFTSIRTEATMIVVPEFPSLLVLPIFIITTLLAAILYRRKAS